MATKWNVIDKEWASELVGLRMKVLGSFWNGLSAQERRTFYGGIIKEYNHDKRRWLIQFDNGDEDQYMRYDAVLRFADEGADTFHDYKLPAIPIPPPDDEVMHDNEIFVIDKLNWTEIIPGTDNPPEVPDMEPIPYTGEREEFDVRISEEEINSMKDSNGTIRFMNVMRWCLPRFDDGETDLFTWQAHRMSNYLRHLLTKQLDVTTNPPEKRFVPRFFHPLLNEGEDESKKVDIEPHHVERLYGVMMARMLQGDASVPDMYTTRSWFKHNAPAVESMPRNCLQDLIRLLHFVDDWEIEEDENWDDTFDYPRYDNHEDDNTAPHRVKFGIIETEYVKRWQQCVRFGRWITADESRLAGWYH